MSEKRDLGRDGHDVLPWTQDQALESVNSLYREAIGAAGEALAWYHAKRIGVRRAARWCRALTIIFLTASGLVPIVSSIAGFSPATTTSPAGSGLNPLWATLFLGLAGGLMGMDRYFGCSRTWMRYLLTAQQIAARRDLFRHDWEERLAGLCGARPGEAWIAAAIRAVRDFRGDVNGLVHDETCGWAADLATSLAQLESAAAANAPAGGVLPRRPESLGAAAQ